MGLYLVPPFPRSKNANFSYSVHLTPAPPADRFPLTVCNADWCRKLDDGPYRMVNKVCRFGQPIRHYTSIRRTDGRTEIIYQRGPSH